MRICNAYPLLRESGTIMITLRNKAFPFRVSLAQLPDGGICRTLLDESGNVIPVDDETPDHKVFSAAFQNEEWEAVKKD